MKEFDSKVVAAYILQRCASNNVEINATQLQKILYCCYGVFLALSEDRLTSEHPQAWPYGPVFPRVFNAMRKGKLDLPTEEVSLFTQNISAAMKARLDQTIEFFSQFPAGKLSAWTHIEGSPWDQSTEHGKLVPKPMDDFLIMKYFRDHVLIPGLTLETPLQTFPIK